MGHTFPKLAPSLLILIVAVWQVPTDHADQPEREEPASLQRHLQVVVGAMGEVVEARDVAIVKMQQSTRRREPVRAQIHCYAAPRPPTPMAPARQRGVVLEILPATRRRGHLEAQLAIEVHQPPFRPATVQLHRTPTPDARSAMVAADPRLVPLLAPAGAAERRVCRLPLHSATLRRRLLHEVLVTSSVHLPTPTNPPRSPPGPVQFSLSPRAGGGYKSGFPKQ